MMASTIRAFIAFEIPVNIREALRSVQDRLKGIEGNIRWVRPDNIHLTLKFLGDIQCDGIVPIGEAMAAAAQDLKPMSLTTKGIGVFPGIKRPRVIWAGLSGDCDRLRQLQQDIENRLAALDYPAESRPFKSHLTLGRVKGPVNPKGLLEVLNTCSGFESQPFTAEEVILFKSDLKPSGAVYTKLFSYGF